MYYRALTFENFIFYFFMSGFHHGQRWQQRAMILFYFILFYLFFLILFFQASTMGQRWQQRAKRRHSKPLRHIFSKVSFLEALHKKYTEGSTDMILLPGGIIRRAWDWVFFFSGMQCVPIWFFCRGGTYDAPGTVLGFSSSFSCWCCRFSNQ